MIDQRVNIIIPIYNSYEFVKKCIESVIKYTPKEEYNLILINDSSTDERINQYLKEIENSQHSNVFIHNNEINLGFIKSVNIGMEFDINNCSNNILNNFKKIFKNDRKNKNSNDVLLLNSDTEVTPNWLRKIKVAAYSKENIATVSPLTNNGTICSVPENLKDNDIPNNLTVNEFAEIIEKTSLKLYPEVPTTVGFCMYIKRSVLNKIGLFDYELFGKGYAEENDFCCRCNEENYIHIICDDTFIYHKGSMSFGDDNNVYIMKNLKILNKKFPYYERMIHEFIQKDSLKPIIDNIKLQLKIRNNKKNILFVVHNDILKDKKFGLIGGTELHTKDLIYNINSINSYCLYTEKDTLFIQSFVGNNEVLVFKYKLDNRIDSLDFHNRVYNEYLERIVQYFNIDIIHVQHFIRNTFDVVDVAKKYNIPIFITLHDYYLICPKVNLIDNNNKFCELKADKDICNECLFESYGYIKDTIEVWNKNAYYYLKQFDRVFAPSKSVIENFELHYKKKYGEFDINIEVIEHGFADLLPNSHKEDNKFRVGFVGGLSKVKGSTAIYNIIKNCENEDIEFHIFGAIGDIKLRQYQKENLIKHGVYDRDEIHHLLIDNNIQLVCILSIWPETYSYTLSEAIESNIPVLATDLGAVKDRINEYDCGWIVPYNSSYKVALDMINKIIDDRNCYNNKILNINSINTITREVIYQKYKEIYLSVNKQVLDINVDNNRLMLNSIIKIIE